MSEVAEFQAVQTQADRVALRVVPTSRFSTATVDVLRHTLGALLGPGMAVHVELVDRIPTLPSGKRRLIEPLPPL